jgi:hypothetical protein
MKLNKLKTLAVAAIFATVLALGAAALQAATLTVANGTSGTCTGTYSTIQAAVNAASPGDTISVCQGTYPELVQISKTLNFLGAQNGVDARTRAVPATSESTVGSGDGAFQILADNVVINGFTIQGVVNDPSQPPFTSLGAGVWSNPGFTGTQGGFQILNNIIQNNIIGIEMDNTGAIQAKVQHNLIQNNNNSGPDGGTGIDTNFGASNVVVDSNKFVGHTNSAIGVFSAGSSITWSNNEFASNRRAFGLFNVTSSSITNNNIHNSNDSATADLRLFGGVSSLTVSCNTFANGAGFAIRINDAGFTAPTPDPNSMITINMNNISGYSVAGLQVDTGGYSGGPMSLDATNDWWGAASGPNYNGGGPGTGEPIVDPAGVVKFSPFLGNPSGCAVCPNSNPGCTTTRKDCQAFVEQEEKNFNDMQKTQKKNFDDGQKMQKQQFDATHPTPAQRKAFENQQKMDKQNFDNMQKSANDSFQAHYKAEEQQCSQIPK